VINNTAIDRANGQSVQILQDTIGNTDLKPEIADNTEVGFVYRPHFVPGLSLSVDYFDIVVKGAISNLNAQQVVDLCYNGGSAFCKDVNLTGAIGTANPSYVALQGFNLASLSTDGVDLEVSYSFDLRRWSLPGAFQFRALATRTLSSISNPGIPGQIVQQYAGDNNADTPYWKAYLPESWTFGRASVTVTERIVSDGLINPNFITCQAGSCPASSVQHPTTDFNKIPGALYLDLGGSYDLNRTSQIYFKIDNVFNDHAPPFSSPTIYDVIGAMFRIGFRYTH
jgi:iron complex outermembrane receptor protein